MAGCGVWGGKQRPARSGEGDNDVECGLSGFQSDCMNFNEAIRTRENQGCFYFPLVKGTATKRRALPHLEDGTVWENGTG